MEVIQDLREANRCIRELAVLSLLPAIWTGENAAQIRENLADGLQNSLRAEIVYVRCNDGRSGPKPESIRITNASKVSSVEPAFRESVVEAIERALGKGGSDLVQLSLKGKEFRLAVMPLGPAQEFGVIAAGSIRPDFPTASERLLLSVSVNQAIIAFRSAKQAKQLADAAEHRRLALEAANLGAWDYQFDSGKIFWDERCRNMWGIFEGFRVDYQSVLQRLHPDDQEPTRRAVANALTGIDDGKYRREFRVLWPDGSEHWIASHGQAHFEDRAKTRPIRFVGIVREITNEKRASEILEQTVQDRTVKLKETIAEMEAFSYSISHDMRSPLRAMQGYADALLEQYQDRLDDNATHYLERIRRGASRLDLLIQDVLAYSKIAKGDVDLAIVDLGAVVSDVIENYPQLQPHNASLAVLGPLPKVLGHEAYLTQIVSNLLGNAVKFVRPGEPPEVKVWAENGGPSVRVWFEDNGIGIHPRHHNEIFQIFGRVYSEKKYEGTGIGLAIVRKAAERMGGCVGVVSELGKGSRFWLTLKSPK